MYYFSMACLFPSSLAVNYFLEQLSQITKKFGRQQVSQYVENENRLSRKGTIGLFTNRHGQF